MELILLRSILCFMVVIMVATISSCATVQTKEEKAENPEAIVKRSDYTDQKKEKVKSRETIAKRNYYTDQKDKLTVSSLKVKPVTVTRGNKLTFQLTYTLLSSDTKKEFDVVDVTMISGSGLLIELSKKTSRKSRGSHISKLEFVVPPDLPPGSYKLISIIRAAGQKKQRQCNFTVKR